MKLKGIITLACVGLGMSSMAQDLKLTKDNIDKVIKAMTVEEKAMMLTGTGMAGFSGDNAVVGATQSIVPGAAGTTWPIERLGIPAIVLADGPAGLRIEPTRKGDSDTYYCTAFPVGTLIASSWDTELAESIGTVMGNEVLEYGVDVLLAPALNIHRNPLCGRNFEYYSEDPVLSGDIAAAVVNGVQSAGVGTSIKHFAVNNQETNRTWDDAQVSTRALREIYLRSFERVVKASQPWTVMSSYNRINGTFASESRGLLTDILRSEWGYKGLVMTDWFGGKNPPAQTYAGNDLLMPGTPMQKDAIVKAVKDGSLDVKDLDICVKRVLELIVRTPRFNGYEYSNKPDLNAHKEVARAAATEGIILLKNDNNALPFASTVSKVAAFGVTSYDFISGGTGSGDVNEAYVVSLGDGLKNANLQINEQVKSMYEDYIAAENAKKEASDNPMMKFFSLGRMAEPTINSSLLKKAAKESDVALITIGRNSGEFADRNIDGDFELSAAEQAMIKSVTAAFKAKGKKTVVVLNVGGVIETASWKNIPDAILLPWQGGQEGGNSIVDVLTGKVNPSGKLPMTFPVKYFDHASSANFPHDFKFDPTNAMGSLMNSKTDSNRKNVDYTIYEEGIYVGYRYFDSFNKAVSYPFGFGLSYTDFEMTDASVKQSEQLYTLKVKVTNTGKVAGKEVVQVYLDNGTSKVERPAKELIGFGKTKSLKPGESQVVSINFYLEDMAYFDEAASAWTLAAGKYNVLVSNSSCHSKLSVSLDAPAYQYEAHKVLVPEGKINELKK